MVDFNNPPSPVRRNPSFTTRIMVWTDDFFRYFRQIQKQPVPIQIGVGAVGGWIGGYFLTKGSKILAIVMGCSLILIQFFNYRGYIRFHRNQFQRDVDQISSKIQTELGLKRKGFPRTDEVDDFVTRNGFFFSGFLAGNLIGYGMA